MRIVFTYDVVHGEKIVEVIKNYNLIKIPNMTTQINHIRRNDTPMIRLLINGDDDDVKNLINLLNESI